MKPEDFKTRIDWPFLFLMGSVIGLIRTMNYLGVDNKLISTLSWLGNYMQQDFMYFILILSAMITMVRFFLPMVTTNFIFAAALLPVANAVGVNPWLVGFIILVISETSIFNYQSPHIQLFKEKSQVNVENKELYFAIFRSLLLGIKILAIYASIPFWIRIGIL